jgi:hypothetical protein
VRLLDKKLFDIFIEVVIFALLVIGDVGYTLMILYLSWKGVKKATDEIKKRNKKGA